jgi:ribosomal protein S18 acetylase RimI-like enzyme
MENLIFRKAKLDDRDQLDALFREELEYHKRLLPDVFKIPDKLIDESWLKSTLDNDNSSLVVAEHTGTIVGAILYNIKVNPADSIYNERIFGYIEELIVKESFREKGIGKKLLDFAISDLKNRDVNEIELNVWENNKLGQEFFKKYGFKTIQRRMKLDQ